MVSLAIIEDNIELAHLLEKNLEKNPNINLVGIRTNGTEGIELVEVAQPDVVIIDIGLPDISGIECIKQLKPVYPQIEFVVFTISDDDMNIFNALKNGATSYILKNEPTSKIVDAIYEVKNGGTTVSSTIARKMLRAFTEYKCSNNTDAQKEEFRITEREEDVLNLLSEGFLYKEIAKKLFISEKTLKSHIYRIYGKLHVNNRTEAINTYYVNKSCS